MKIPSPHEALIREVLETAERGNLLQQGAHPPLTLDNLKIVFDLAEDDQIDSDNQESLAWPDIKSHEMRSYPRDFSSSFRGEVIRCLETFRPRLWSAVENQLARRISPKTLQAAFNDLFAVMLIRGTYGKSHSFWELVFKIYKSGGMPLGWDGTYPSGKIIACYLPAVPQKHL